MGIGASQTFVSPSRLARFSILAVQGSIAKEMHEWNFRAAGEILATAGRMEVLVRHAAGLQLTRLAEVRGSRYWPLTLEFDDHETRVIRRAYKQAASIADLPHDAYLVAENVPLGFWLQLLSSRYHTRLWVPGLNRGFLNLEGSASVRRESLHCSLERAVLLRNLAAHVQPLHLLQPEEVLEPFRAVAGAIDPAAALWVVQSSRLFDVWDSRPTAESPQIPTQTQGRESGMPRDGLL